MELLKDQSIGIDNRANIFISSMGELTSNECQYCLKLLEFHEFSKIFETNRRPRIPINTMNQKVLIALKEKGFVDSFVEDKVNKVFKSIRRRSDRDEV